MLAIIIKEVESGMEATNWGSAIKWAKGNL